MHVVHCKVMQGGRCAAAQRHACMYVLGECRGLQMHTLLFGKAHLPSACARRKAFIAGWSAMLEPHHSFVRSLIRCLSKAMRRRRARSRQAVMCGLAGQARGHVPQRRAAGGLQRHLHANHAWSSGTGPHVTPPPGWATAPLLQSPSHTHTLPCPHPLPCLPPSPAPRLLRLPACKHACMLTTSGASVRQSSTYLPATCARGARHAHATTRPDCSGVLKASGATCARPARHSGQPCQHACMRRVPCLALTATGQDARPHARHGS